MLIYNPLTHKMENISDEKAKEITEKMKEIDKNVIDLKLVSLEDFKKAMCNKETFILE